MMNHDSYEISRLEQELALQNRSDQNNISKSSRFSLLGTRKRGKLTESSLCTDFFFQHLIVTADGQFAIAEDARNPSSVDFWLCLFRNGFSFQQRAPSGHWLTYNWSYIDWLRRKGNEYVILFCKEPLFRIRLAILKSLVRATVVQCAPWRNQIPTFIPQEGEKIGSLFIVLPNNIVGLVLQDGKTGVKAPGDVLERYGIDNYNWDARTDILDLSEDVGLRAMCALKQTRRAILHSLFLWSTAIIKLLQSKSMTEVEAGSGNEIIGRRAAHVVATFQQRPSSCAKLKKHKVTICDKVPSAALSSSEAFSAEAGEEGGEEEQIWPLNQKTLGVSFLQWQSSVFGD